MGSRDDEGNFGLGYANFSISSSYLLPTSLGVLCGSFLPDAFLTSGLGDAMMFMPTLAKDRLDDRALSAS